MSHNGNAGVDELQLTRQRVCEACHAFVSFSRVDAFHCACPLCSARYPMSPNFVKFMTAAELAKLIAKKPT